MINNRIPREYGLKGIAGCENGSGFGFGFAFQGQAASLVVARWAAQLLAMLLEEGVGLLPRAGNFGSRRVGDRRGLGLGPDTPMAASNGLSYFLGAEPGLTPVRA